LLPVEAGLVRPSLAAQVISPPYDLLTAAQRAEVAAGNPRSFLHGIPSSESDDPEADAARRHQQARAYVEARLAEETWAFAGEVVYVYRIQSGDHAQTGVVGDVPAWAFPGLIRPHEHTRPPRVADLVDYLEKVRVGSSPVGVTYRRQPEIDAIVTLITEERPELDVVLGDGDRQQVWAVAEPEVVEGLVAAFADVGSAYIVDGHHRVAATLQRGSDPATPAGRFLAVAFPDDDLAVYPFHRWLASDWSPAGSPSPTPLEPGPGRAVAVTRRGEWGLVLDDGRDDASALTSRILGPHLAVTDDRIDSRLTYIPGYPGPGALRAKVAAEGGVGFLLHPPTVDQVMAVSDRGEVMPPKATFFSPKPRSGIFLVKR
jgi:uncharacterized protein (DUF1015 family)